MFGLANLSKWKDKESTESMPKDTTLASKPKNIQDIPQASVQIPLKQLHRLCPELHIYIPKQDNMRTNAIEIDHQAPLLQMQIGNMESNDVMVNATSNVNLRECTIH
jgi:hypothetical protein